MVTIRTETENDVLSSICDYLMLRKHFFWRTNNTPIFDKDHFRAMPKYSMKGVPDIIVIKDGFFVGLECKTKKGKQSPDQMVFEFLAKANGAEYYVVKSIDDVKEVGL